MRSPAIHCLLFVCLLCLCSAAFPLDLYTVAPIYKLAPDEAVGKAWVSGRLALEAARNECEATQIVLRSATPVEGLRLALSDWRGEKGATLPVGEMRLYHVEYVDINAPFDVDKPSTNPLMRPDPLPPVQADESFAVQPGRNLVFWLSVRVPAEARPGLYKGQVRVLQGDKVLATLPAQLRVRAFQLPQRPILQSLVSFSEGTIYKAHGAKTPEEKEKLIRLYFEEYIRARLSPFLYAPGNAAFSPLPNAKITWTFAKDADGKPTGEATVDFTGFDREGERYLDQRDAFSAFNFAPYMWTRRDVDGKKRQMVLRFVDAAGTAVERRNPDGSLNPVFDQLVIKVFGDIAKHLAEKKWLDRAVYYVTDEPSDSDAPAIKEVCELVRKADPRIRTALTYDPANRPALASLVDEQGKSLISIWVPYFNMYREDVAAEQRKKGAHYWLYDVSSTCLIGHTGEKNRSIYWNIWERDTEGFLYYLTTWWGRTASPWERPNFMLPEFTYQYRQGDGFFFYPPLKKGEPQQPMLDYVVPTIRWELWREGAEDYDYLRMLEDLTQRAEQRKLPAAAEGRKALAIARDFARDFSSPGAGYGVRDLIFTAAEGWGFGLEEGWMQHKGGKRSDQLIKLNTKLPDGRYQLVLDVYDDADYRGQQYSSFLVNGKPFSTPMGGLKGPANVPTVMIDVKGGQTEFTLSSVPENKGVILYHAFLKPVAETGLLDLYAVRSRIADNIEKLTAALGR
ncbi:MAG: DUF4091 domain-containing protein [Armatimonadia bacterium]